MCKDVCGSGAGIPNIYNLWPLLMNAKCKKKGYAAVFMPTDYLAEMGATGLRE